MNVAAASTGLSQVQVQQSANVKVLKMAMESAEMQQEMLKEMIRADASVSNMEQSVMPHLGAALDMYL
ncbi:YjfB family protein [Anoxynatronum sibiricum]|uniref:YjfB family protein n=1 Tax=Anoxynatronum sibiricum TaxID=210623 RepID=A0ABU9VUC8_9CLOT